MGKTPPVELKTQIKVNEWSPCHALAPCRTWVEINKLAQVVHRTVNNDPEIFFSCMAADFFTGKCFELGHVQKRVGRIEEDNKERKEWEKQMGSLMLKNTRMCNHVFDMSLTEFKERCLVIQFGDGDNGTLVAIFE